MDKALCDKIICEYTDKLFGFAMTKTRSIRRAEELASRITLEVYASLLRRDSVTNIPAYIYRVAQNVWARYTDEYRRSPYVNIDDGDVWDGEDFTEQVEQSETYAKLRTEIAHLSETRREILVLHYYAAGRNGENRAYRRAWQQAYSQDWDRSSTATITISINDCSRKRGSFET